ncbi:MAG: hypothetical protein WBM98_08625 [Maribacter sp.]|uniref:hypothetical protein n=1 Tax=Maribacter sp. TaxID=1897614 RepID=UPI003C766FA3
MKKVKLLFGIVILSTFIVSFTGSDKCDNTENNESLIITDLYPQFEENLILQAQTENVKFEELLYIEDEEIVNLGFDTADYLPYDFNPYQGMIFDLEDIIYVEEEEEIELNFNTSTYLPKNFNAYSNEALNVEDVMYIESEDEIDLGFDTADYLPKGFNPFKEMQTVVL